MLIVATGEPFGRAHQVSGPYTACTTHHAPNAKGNFCFEATLGYRRLERGR